MSCNAVRTLTLVLVALLSLGIAGCQRPAAAPAKSSNDDSSPATSAQSQGERTKAMEEKARELDRRAAEIQNMQGTEQDKIDAVNKLEQDRQELNRSGDGSTPPPH